MRATKKYGVRQQSVFNRVRGAKPMAAPEPVAEPAKVDAEPAAPMDAMPIMVHEKISNNAKVDTVLADENPDFPIPRDFDIDVGGTDSGDFGVPVFSDIKFDDDDDDEAEEQGAESETTPNAVCEMLKSAGIDARIDGDLIKTDKFAIAVHGDEDFWVADELDWFASGKQKRSPIVELTASREADGLSPILYLASDGIMDLEKLAPEWESAGITVVKSSDELLKVVGC